MLNVSRVLFIGIAVICLTGWINSAAALLLGVVLALTLGNPFAAQSKVGVKHLLKIAVIGLGFGIQAGEALATSVDTLGITAMTIVTTVLLGWLLAKSLNMDRHLGHLISSGTAICGGSAIAAVAPVINAHNKHITVAIAVVFLLNAVALLIFPAIGTYLDLTQYQFGVWSAIAIHDTSSVVGAALAYGDEALKTATTVKLARTLWIIPLALVSMVMFKSQDSTIKIPWFIAGFIIAMLINSAGWLPESVTGGITLVAKRLLILTLFLVGSSLSLADIKETGWRPMLMAVILWLFISILSWFMVVNWT
ncbi:YeiH family protein [Marinicella gelatinilytica]|uniref:YeiH family protein n=1 Tax=Marinicella gelatinilytica TaxID=2996017 RepID=UPI002260D03F|nr:putative sulfate exporter family transporter [Marinicella gelatinilytica]MCX7544815.1 putative sulfate exporter family transporter [Marinicella gelatinilytica]